MNSSYEWIAGTPTEKGHYWVETSDQGGWPGLRLCTVMFRWKPMKDVIRFQEASIAVMKHSMTVEAFNNEFLELMFCLDSEGENRCWERLNQFRNCNRYVRIEEPKL